MPQFKIYMFLILSIITHSLLPFVKSEPLYETWISNSSLFKDTEYEGVNREDIKSITVYVTAKNFSQTLTQFWKSTGLCPPDPHQDSYKFLLSNDMKQNAFHIGSLPKSSIEQVRIHWLLDLIKLRVYHNFKINIDFKYLDKLIHILWKNNLQPGFELMGNPSNVYTDFENATQVYLWKYMVQSIANHYIKLFGIEYVKKWNFETWNEPDHHDFDNLNFTTQGFLNYFDACSEGLKAANSELRLGGPGGSCRIPSEGKSPLCWALLSHCSYGRNFFTGERGVRLDFISFHKKGNGSTLPIFYEEIKTMLYIRKNYPVLSHVPFFNDEADPLKNWSLSQKWRADTSYAAMVVKVILQHIKLFIANKSSIFKDVHFQLLSNDNAFLSYYPNQFTQRTLLARFQINNTSPKYVEFIKKPVYSAFALLSKLGPNILSTKIYSSGKKKEDLKLQFDAFATENEREINIILYNIEELSNKSSIAEVVVNLDVPLLKYSKWAAFELNNIYTNPYLIWQKQGMPVYPTTYQLYMMKNNEEPYMRGPYEILISRKIKFKMLNPGVTLINVCKLPVHLYKVKNIRFFQTHTKSLQISWMDDNRCVLTYNIEKSFFKDGPFHRLNLKNFTLPSYWHSCFENDLYCSVSGYYRIYAIDYWGNAGPYSQVTKF